ncbi:hypothetical protein ACF2JD_15155 [Aeromonas sp. A-5]
MRSSGREGVNRELNFTTTATLPIDNKLVAGKWLGWARRGVGG